MPDLIEFLREEADDWEPDGKDYELGMRSPTAQFLRDAADEIEKLRKRVKALEEVPLKPKIVIIRTPEGSENG